MFLQILYFESMALKLQWWYQRTLLINWQYAGYKDEKADDLSDNHKKSWKSRAIVIFWFDFPGNHLQVHFICRERPTLVRHLKPAENPARSIRPRPFKLLDVLPHRLFQQVPEASLLNIKAVPRTYRMTPLLIVHHPI